LAPSVRASAGADRGVPVCRGVKIRLLCIGTRSPAWVTEGYDTYARRLQKDNQLILEEVPRPRPAATLEQRLAAEGERLLARLKAPEQGRRKGSEIVIALDEAGAAWRTADLAAHMRKWRAGATDVALLVGGPDGLAPACRERADALWSLSPLTLPHALVRVLVAEQVYRAWTLITGHPYHRS
jgi:23S rRNA (pseudouridine1915-N3)-methyltransferase